jgi:hypothetical protein
MTGEVVAGVSMVVVPPETVVTVTVSGDGMKRVAVPPDGVWIWTELWVDGISRVAVPPPRVSTPEMTTVGLVATVSVWPRELTIVTEVGVVVELTKAVLETETVWPDSVTYGRL